LSHPTSGKKSGRHPSKTYFKLTLIAVLLVGLNYTFTKLFDMVFGKTDPWYALGILIALFIFVGLFTFILWYADKNGEIARLMGARDGDE
jgi:hypothetical protein